MAYQFYSLSFNATPGSQIKYRELTTGELTTFTVPESGVVPIYVGQTRLTLKHRLMKHQAALRQLIRKESGERIQAKNYPLYRFLFDFGVSPDQLQITSASAPISDFSSASERALIAAFKNAGLPLMNKLLTGATKLPRPVFAGILASLV
jgi:hypothetical protein